MAIKALEDRIRVTDVLMVVSTIVIAAAAIANVMVVNGQLAEMRASGHQTDQLIESNRKLAVAAERQTSIAGQQTKITQEQLHEMQSTGQRADRLIETNRQLASAAERQAQIANEQSKTTQGQLEEMMRQRSYTVDQLRASLSRDTFLLEAFGRSSTPLGLGDILRGWNVSPVWKNKGATDARDVVSWWDITIVKTPSGPAKRVKSDCPVLQRPTEPITSSLLPHDGTLPMQAKRLRLEDAVKASGPRPSTLIYLMAHAEYHDNFPESPLHRRDWCVLAVPKDIPKAVFSYTILKDSID
jgi:hypothetical protein